jgi:ceramide glucosyltransferase
VKGLDTCLYQCLESTFRQSYPISRLTIYLCIADRSDPALPVLERIISDFPAHDARLFVESEDSYLQGEDGRKAMGPNPKIRTMSRAYREAKGDIVWIMDCNVWVSKGSCGRMVDRLCGYGGYAPNKFVHQLPLVVDVDENELPESRGLLSSPSVAHHDTIDHIPIPSTNKHTRSLWATGGGRLEEAWFSAAHAKFYTAINTVSVAPCIVGKSNMFRRSHLNALTDGQGISVFSHNICEDHLIGDLLWKTPVPADVLDAARNENDKPTNRPWGNHALNFGDLALQPIANMAINEFFLRRVRWLRVRKFTVIAATLVEPGTESFLCSLYGAFAVTSLPFFSDTLGIPRTWTAFALFWLLSIAAWATVDRALFHRMQSGRTIDEDEHTPPFARFRHWRGLRPWLLAWIGRECLALPIWLDAVFFGAEVGWRGKTFRVATDMRVQEVVQ